MFDGRANRTLLSNAEENRGPEENIQEVPYYSGLGCKVFRSRVNTVMNCQVA